MTPVEFREFLLGFGGNILASLFGVLFAFVIRDRVWNAYRFGGSHVRLIWNGELLLDRKISWEKAKEIAEEASELSVYLKGVASPYEWIRCDMVLHAESSGLLTIDKQPKRIMGEKRQYTIYLDHNPPAIPYKDWRVLVVKDQQEAVNLALRPEIVASVKNKEENFWLFLAGLAAPYGLDDVAGVAQAMDQKLLVVDDKKKSITINLDPPPTEEPATEGLIVVNFAHPLTSQQQEQIKNLSGQAIAQVRQEVTQTQIDNARPLAPQARAIVERIGLSPDEWSTMPLLVIPPAYAPASNAVLAELHGRMGHFPTIARLRLNPDEVVTTYDVVELVNLQQERDDAREQER